MELALGGNRVKHLSSLFLMTGERGDQRFIGTKLLLCLLISVAVGLMNGCDRDRDIGDLSKKHLVVCWITIEDSTLPVQHATDLTAELIYNGKDRELRYNWSVSKDEGKIQNNGKRATYLAPEEPGTYLIRFEVCNGPIRASDTVSVTVVPDPTATGGMPPDNTGMVDPTTGEPQNPEQPKDAGNQNPAEPAPANTGKAEPPGK